MANTADVYESQEGGQVTALNAGQTVLNAFWDLASLEEDARAVASQKLVNELIKDQAEHESTGKAAEAEAAAQEPEPGAPKVKQLEYALRRCSPVLIYALRRLAKGLASSRQGARQGYAVALTCVLAQTKVLTASDVLVLLESSLEGPLKGGEAKDLLMGRIFGLGALVRSGLPLDASTTSAILTQLLDAGARKSFLQESAAAVVVEAAGRLSASELATCLNSCPSLRTLLTSPIPEATPEAMYIALMLWPVLPKEVLVNCQLLPAGAPKPPVSYLMTLQSTAHTSLAATGAALFESKYLQRVLPVLLQTSSSHPRLHTLWVHLLPFLLPGFKPHKEAEKGEKGAPGQKQFDAFWSTVVEKGLLESSHERKYLAMQLFQIMLPHMRPSQLSTSLSPSFLRMLLNNLKHQESYLHATARKCIDHMTAFVGKPGVDATAKMAVAAALQRVGAAAPKALGKSKVILGQLISGMDAEGIHAYIQSLVDAFLAGKAPLAGDEQEDKDVEEGPQKKKVKTGDVGGSSSAPTDAEGAAETATAIDNARRQCVEQLIAAVKFPEVSDADRRAVLRFLLLHAFFKVDPSKGAKSKLPEVRAALQLNSTQALSDGVRRTCAQRLVTLVHTLGRAPAAQNATTASAQPENGAHQQPNAEKAASHASEKSTEKGSKKGGKDKESSDKKGPQQEEPHQFSGPYLGFVVSVLHELAAAPALDWIDSVTEEKQTLLTTLRELEDAIGRRCRSDPAPRVRALLALSRVLQLHVCGDTEPLEVSLVLDLRRVATQGFGVEGLEDADEQEEDEGESEEEPDSWPDVILDALLALLARPSAPLPSGPLREACEGLWRTVADSLTPSGMADLIRVISAGDGEPGAGAAADLFEEDEEEEEVEEVHGSDSDDEESEDDDGGSEHDEEAAKAAANGTQQQSKKRVREQGSDDEDVEVDSEDEDMDDDAMFRMDDRLAAYLRQMVDARRSAAERKEALQNLKLRAVTLLDMYARKLPGSPLLVPALLPLLKAVARPTNQPALAQKVRALLSSRLSKSKLVLDPATVSQADLEAMLKKTMYIASRSKAKEACATGGDVLFGILKAAATATASDDAPESATQSLAVAQSTFKAAVHDFFNKKKSRLPRQTLDLVLRQAPAVSFPCLSDIVKEATAARHPHLQVEALQLLASLLRTPPQSGPGVPDLAKTMKPLAPALGTALASGTAGVGLNKNLHADAVKHACSCLEGLKKLHGGDKRLPEMIGSENVNALVKAVVTARSLSVQQKVETQFVRLVQLLGASELVAKTKPDPALASRIQKAKPQPQPQPEQKQGQSKATKEAPHGGKKADGNAKQAHGQKAEQKQQKQQQKQDKTKGGKADSAAAMTSKDKKPAAKAAAGTQQQAPKPAHKQVDSKAPPAKRPRQESDEDDDEPDLSEMSDVDDFSDDDQPGMSDSDSESQEDMPQRKTSGSQKMQQQQHAGKGNSKGKQDKGSNKQKRKDKKQQKH